jgi:hypothetical protein
MVQNKKINNNMIILDFLIMSLCYSLSRSYKLPEYNNIRKKKNVNQQKGNNIYSDSGNFSCNSSLKDLFSPNSSHKDPFDSSKSIANDHLNDINYIFFSEKSSVLILHLILSEINQRINFLNFPLENTGNENDIYYLLHSSEIQLFPSFSLSLLYALENQNLLKHLLFSLVYILFSFLEKFLLIPVDAKKYVNHGLKIFVNEKNKNKRYLVENLNSVDGFSVADNSISSVSDFDFPFPSSISDIRIYLDEKNKMQNRLLKYNQRIIKF